MDSLPICIVTGRIAGDSDACGDCGPCSAAHAVKRLMRERDEWREKYAETAVKADERQAILNDIGRWIARMATVPEIRHLFAMSGVQFTDSDKT